MPPAHDEHHQMETIGWLRAAVLGANDGLLSTATLIMGVGAAHGSAQSIMTASVAGLFAGATSMAAGEYVPVHSQADTDAADLEREHAELAAIYVGQGLDPRLAREVADQLMAHEALGAHARAELGFSEAMKARPIQAALACAASFAVGAVLPLLVIAFTPAAHILPVVAVTSILLLSLLGAFAMATTAGAAALFGTVV
jgi:vacuolar iron transporter family protein